MVCPTVQWRKRSKYSVTCSVYSAEKKFWIKNQLRTETWRQNQSFQRFQILVDNTPGFLLTTTGLKLTKIKWLEIEKSKSAVEQFAHFSFFICLFIFSNQAKNECTLSPRLATCNLLWYFMTSTNLKLFCNINMRSYYFKFTYLVCNGLNTASSFGPAKPG